VRWLIWFLLCLLFAGPHIFTVPLPPVAEVKVQSSIAEKPSFWDQAEGKINRWMKNNLPDFVYDLAPKLFAPTFETLASLYRWGRIVTQDPQTGFMERQAAHGILWIFYHPWISALVGLVLMFRGRRWIFAPLRRIFLRRR
jgi:hypothetical protein